MSLGKLDYSILSAVLTTSVGKELDIKDIIESIDIYESLMSPYIKVDLGIVDSANFLESAPIIGQEKLELTILCGGYKIRKKFYVGSIADYIRANNQASIYTMKLITEEQMMNSLLLVSQSYTGTISDSISAIVRDYLKSKVTTDPSIGNYRVVIPNWNPFQAIDWLSRRGVNSKQVPFAFYETIAEGFKYECYDTMFNKKPFDKFVHKGGTTAESDAEQQGASMRVAIEYDLRDYSNTYKNTLRGTFGSGMHSVDIATKTYKFLKYDYQDDFKKKSHLDKVPFINEKFTVDGKQINQYDATHFTINKNSKAFGKEQINNYSNETEFTKLEADPFLFQLSLTKMNLVVRGRINICPGKIIEFEVDRDKPMLNGNVKESNEYISGKYLVMNVRHKMTQGKYTILMDCARDSLGKKVK